MQEGHGINYFVDHPMKKYYIDKYPTLVCSIYKIYTMFHIVVSANTGRLLKFLLFSLLIFLYMNI